MEIALTKTEAVVLADSSIGLSNASAFIIRGTCPAGASSLSISGSASGSASCSAGSFSVVFDLSAVADGALSFHIKFTNSTGEELSSSDLKVNKDTSVPAGEIPPGAVIPFNASSCPSGWTRFLTAEGRVLVGAGSGNTDALGGALTSRIFGATGGREFTTGLPAVTSLQDNTPIGPGKALATTAENFYSAAAPDLWLGGQKADSNLPPFVARVFCKKTQAAPDFPTGATVYFNSATCGSSGWALDASAKGRVFLGAGSGNLDADGTPLTNRLLGDTGGREYTTGVPVSTSVGNLATPVPQAVPAALSSGTKLAYGTDVPLSTLSGNKTDSNMPPFRALTACVRDLAQPIASASAGLVAAFDLAACPTGWSAFNELSGRTPVAAGSGNLDADGTALTSRANGQTGGLEYTTGLPVSVSDGGDNIPMSGDLLAQIIGTVGTNVSSAPANTTLYGAKADSNMPPFLVLLYCQKN